MKTKKVAGAVPSPAGAGGLSHLGNGEKSPAKPEALRAERAGASESLGLGVRSSFGPWRFCKATCGFGLRRSMRLAHVRTDPCFRSTANARTSICVDAARR